MVNRIQDSPLWEYFDEERQPVEICVLNVEAARAKWHEHFGAGSRSYFDLPNDAWPITAHKSEIGSWIESLNSGHFDVFARVLADKTAWSDSTIVLFFANASIGLRCSWAEFKSHWSSFLTLESDGALVVPDEHKMQCILFTALGEARFLQAFPEVSR